MEKSFDDVYRPRELNEKEKELFLSLQEIEGVEVVPGVRELYTFQLRFRDEEALVSLRIRFFDEESGADVAITNMNTLALGKEKSAESVQKKGRGGVAVKKFLSWTHQKGYAHVIASQVDENARGFWTKMGFVYDERQNNGSDDWLYKP